jgi:ATP-binding cassette subfamily F protein 3
MRHALTMALQGYEGALVVISHDRHLLRNTVDEFYLVANGSVDEFNGDLKDYQQWLKNYNRIPDALDTLSSAQPVAKEAPNQTAEVKASAGSADKKLQRQQSAEARKKLAPLTKKSKKLEQEIEKLQKEQAVNEALLADVEIYTESKKLQLKEQMEIQVRIKKSIAEKEEIWFEIQQEIEQFS